MSMPDAPGGRGRPFSERDESPDLRGTTFGPVPSRRFGRSLGINNIPPKVCTYSCAYCQLGRAVQVRDDRRAFYGADAIVSAVRRRVWEASRASERVDVLTFVPDGEPTLDLGLGRAVHLLRDLDRPIVVLTNGSLLFRPDVRAALAEADAVSLKVDAVREGTWRRVNRPHRRLRLTRVLDGMREFASGFGGGSPPRRCSWVASTTPRTSSAPPPPFVGELDPATAYLAVPTRPPAERWVVAPPEAALARAYEVFRAFNARVELLVGYEGEAFASTGDPVADLLEHHRGPSHAGACRPTPAGARGNALGRGRRCSSRPAGSCG